MKYKYEDINNLEELKDILLKEINEKADNKKFVKMALSYLQEVLDELSDPNEHIAKCNEIIAEVIEFLNASQCDMICPMCQESCMTHEEYNGTHIYICEPCPFVGFELVETKDRENMVKWLEERK